MAIISLTTFIKQSFGLLDNSINFTGGDSYAGKTVNADSSLSISTVFRCVYLIASAIASLPCGLFELDKLGDPRVLLNDPLTRLLGKRPNASMTSFHFWQAVVACVLLWGNAYGVKKLRGDKSVISIELLFPEYMALMENADGSLTYVYSDFTGRKEYSENEIVHWKGLSISGRIGLSVLAFARQSFGNALALVENSGRLYSNGMRPGGALTMPNFLKGDQREQVRANIADQIGGVAKTGGTIILEGGMKYESLSIPPEDAQMLESQNFSVEDICRWFGVNPILIGAKGASTWGTGIEQINLQFLTYTLGPLLKNIEEESDRSIVPIARRDQVFTKFDTRNFLRADSAGRAALYGSFAQNGIMTRAEIRKNEGLPFIEGSEKLTVQSALTPLDNLGQNAAQPGKIEDTGKV